MVANFLDSHFGHTAQYSYCPDSYYAETPQQHNLRPTVAAQQPRIGRTSLALTRAMDTQHATSLVTTTDSYGEPHGIVRMIARTHTWRRISPPHAIVEAREIPEMTSMVRASTGATAAAHDESCERAVSSGMQGLWAHTDAHWHEADDGRRCRLSAASSSTCTVPRRSPVPAAKRFR